MTKAAPSVSVVVVSRHRPDALARCLTALAQLDYPAFEIVVVADPAAIAGLAAWQGRIRMQAFDAPNISQARNIGITLCAGEIIAFIDDDAVAEPAWLRHLTGPFADPAVMAAGGYVRGRNGISFQWQGRQVDHLAQTTPLPAGDAPVVVAQAPRLALKTEGTNMAFRREVLARMGGFDPALPFYLDETDVNLRLAAAGHKAALVPLAQVHHGFAESARRHANRVPRDLSDVGASLAVFLRKHAGGADPARLAAEQAERARALHAHQRARRLTQDEAARLLATLVAGWQAGLTRDIAPPPSLPQAAAEFLPMPPLTGQPAHVVVAGPVWQRARLLRRARRHVTQGQRVSVFLLSPTALFHRIRFHPEGYWLQTGGVFGKSRRTDPLFRIWRIKNRIAREMALSARSRLFYDQSF